MAIFIGRFLLTAELLNRAASPLIKKQYRFLKDLSFRIKDDYITAEMRGSYSLLSFEGFVALRLLEFIFCSPVYRVDLQLSAEVRPRFLRPLMISLLKREFARLPGVNWRGDQLRLDLAEMPFFVQVKEARAWCGLFSKLRANWDADEKGGLLFNFHFDEAELM